MVQGFNLKKDAIAHISRTIEKFYWVSIIFISDHRKLFWGIISIALSDAFQRDMCNQSRPTLSSEILNFIQIKHFIQKS